MFLMKTEFDTESLFNFDVNNTFTVDSTLNKRTEKITSFDTSSAFFEINMRISDNTLIYTK